MNSSDNRWP
jgi:predicted Rdx family selenoprotein